MRCGGAAARDPYKVLSRGEGCGGATAGESNKVFRGCGCNGAAVGEVVWLRGPRGWVCGSAGRRGGYAEAQAKGVGVWPRGQRGLVWGSAREGSLEGVQLVVWQ